MVQANPHMGPRQAGAHQPDMPGPGVNQKPPLRGPDVPRGGWSPPLRSARVAGSHHWSCPRREKRTFSAWLKHGGGGRTAQRSVYRRESARSKAEIKDIKETRRGRTRKMFPEEVPALPSGGGLRWSLESAKSRLVCWCSAAQRTTDPGRRGGGASSREAATSVCIL